MKQKTNYNQNSKSLLETIKCNHCGHHKAWSKSSGTFCTRCQKDINDTPERLKIKPMRLKGTPPKKK